MVKKAPRGLSPINRMKNFFKIAPAVLLLAACGPGDQPQQPTGENVKVVKAPEFNADSAYSFVAKQVSFGPRVPNTKSHVDCANYLIEKTKQVTDTVIVQRGQVKSADGRTLSIYNIIGRLYPNAATRIMLFSHWDSRWVADQDSERKTEAIDGANDGASGVGVLLEVARIIHAKNPGVGVDIIFMDAEDQGLPDVQDSYCLGTQYWAANPPIPFYKPQYGILLDMVGGKDARFFKEGGSVQNAGFVVDKVWGKAAQLGYADYFVNAERSMIIDDHYYVTKMTNIPCIDIIQFGDTDTQFPFYWHTHKDDMNAVDKNTLKAVGQTLLDVIYNENPL